MYASLVAYEYAIGSPFIGSASRRRCAETSVVDSRVHLVWGAGNNRFSSDESAKKKGASLSFALLCDGSHRCEWLHAASLASRKCEGADMVERASRSGGGYGYEGTGDSGRQPAGTENGAARPNVAAQSRTERLPMRRKTAGDVTWRQGPGADQTTGDDLARSAIEAAQRATSVAALKDALDMVRPPAQGHAAPRVLTSDEGKVRVLRAVAMRALTLSNDPESAGASMAPVFVDAAGIVAGLQRGADEAYAAVHAVASMTRRRMEERHYAAVLTALARSVRALPDRHREAAVLELISDVREMSVPARIGPWLALARVSTGEQEPWPWMREQLLNEARLMPSEDYDKIKRALEPPPRDLPGLPGATGRES